MIENLIFKIFIKYISVFRNGVGGPTFVTGPGSVSRLSSPGGDYGWGLYPEMDQ
jgi:hypothetical protein